MRGLHFFAELTEPECLSLRPFFQEEMFNAGEMIVRQGQALNRMFLVVRGRARQEKILGVTFGASGLEAWQEKELFEERGPGQHFCEEALLGDAPANGDWVALERTELLSLTAESFQAVLQMSDRTAKKLLLALSRSLYCSCRNLAGQFAANAENKRLLRQMQIEQKKIRGMHRIAGSTTANSVSRTLDTILAACMDCLDVEKGSIMIFNGGALRVEAAFGRNREKILGQVQPISEASVSGRCFLGKKPVFIQDIELEQGLNRSPDPGQYCNNSLISMPLLGHAGEGIGVLNVSKTSSEVFTEEDMRVLEDLTLEASSALAHEISLARLYRNFQETCAEVGQARQRLLQVEEKIGRILLTSWPAAEETGGRGP
jgi:CRP-like cAMP-binding protein/putative methionine-R-sulfoxide reductase with GAF domain